ncbi:MAG: hypothetical protein F4X09_10915 [Gammaproteobacteria bacterium]|nr:hypothetical protein [Gammaproteobacteria bacterium]
MARTLLHSRFTLPTFAITVTGDTRTVTLGFVSSFTLNLTVSLAVPPGPVQETVKRRVPAVAYGPRVAVPPVATVVPSREQDVVLRLLQVNVEISEPAVIRVGFNPTVTVGGSGGGGGSTVSVAVPLAEPPAPAQLTVKLRDPAES